MAAFLYEFEWDSVKAQTNLSNHGVGFEQAATVFTDPLAITIPDNEHSVSDNPWITLVKHDRGHYVLLIQIRIMDEFA